MTPTTACAISFARYVSSMIPSACPWPRSQLTEAVTDLCAVINAFEVDARAGLSTAETAVARSDLALAEAQWSRDRSGGIHQLGLRVLAHADAARSAWAQKLADARQELAAAQAEEM